MEEEITAGNTGSSEGTYVKPNAPEFNFDTEIKEQAAAEAVVSAAGRAWMKSGSYRDDATCVVFFI